MTIEDNNGKSSVSVVCPHCRRAYVIKIDLELLHQKNPRALCSRCGGRFYVLESVQGHAPKAGTGGPDSENAPPAVDRAPRAKKRRPTRPPSRYDSAFFNSPTKPSRKSASSIKDKALLQQALREAMAPSGSPVPLPSGRTPSNPPQANTPPAVTDQGDRPHGDSTVEHPLSAPASCSSPASDAAPAAGLAPADPSPAPFPPDLLMPLPWLELVPNDLEALTDELSEQEEALEWVLTERPNVSGDGPPPVPQDAHLGHRTSSLLPEPPFTPERGKDESRP